MSGWQARRSREPRLRAAVARPAGCARSRAGQHPEQGACAAQGAEVAVLTRAAGSTARDDPLADGELLGATSEFTLAVQAMRRGLLREHPCGSPFGFP